MLTVRRSVMLVIAHPGPWNFQSRVRSERKGTMARIQESDAFACLKSDWETAYRFEYRPGTQNPYRACRGDDGTEIQAPAPDELRNLIRADYLARPVPRDKTP